MGGSFGKSETTTFSTPGFAPPSETPQTPPEDCYPVYVNLSFDSYSQDESWDVSENGVVVASSPPYAAGLTQDVQELCRGVTCSLYTTFTESEFTSPGFIAQTEILAFIKDLM